MTHSHKFSNWKLISDNEEIDSWSGTPKGRKVVRERKCKCGYVEREEEVEVYR